MSQILCSTGALIGKPNNRNYQLLKTLSENLSCDGFEFMMYRSWYDDTDDIAAYLQSIEAAIPVMHCEKHIGEAVSKNEMKEALRLFKMNCILAGKIHAGKLVIHLWDGITSDMNFQNNLEAYKYLSEISNNYGIDLLVENVVCNRENPMKHWCELAEHYPDIHFVFDTKMASFHQQIDLLYKEEYSWLWKDGHIRHYHINDYAGGYMEWDRLRTLPVGEGNIDFNAFFSFIRKIQYNGTFTVEATAFNKNGEVDTDMLNRCFSYIRKQIVSGSCGGFNRENV